MATAHFHIMHQKSGTVYLIISNTMNLFPLLCNNWKQLLYIVHLHLIYYCKCIENSLKSLTHSCHGFLKFPGCPWLFPENVKSPWPTELTISQIIPDNGLNAPLTAIPQPFIYGFSKTHVMHMKRYFHNIRCKQDRLTFWKSHISILFNWNEQYSTNTTWFMSVKMYQCTF